MTRYKKTPSRRGWKFTEKDFDVTKQLLSMNLIAKKVAEVTGWGVATINRAAASDSYVDYLTLTQSYNAKSHNQKLEEKALLNNAAIRAAESVGQIVATPESISEEEAVKMTVNSVERIAVALERMADAWENSPKKKGLFS